MNINKFIVLIILILLPFLIFSEEKKEKDEGFKISFNIGIGIETFNIEDEPETHIGNEENEEWLVLHGHSKGFAKWKGARLSVGESLFVNSENRDVEQHKAYCRQYDGHFLIGGYGRRGSHEESQQNRTPDHYYGPSEEGEVTLDRGHTYPVTLSLAQLRDQGDVRCYVHGVEEKEATENCSQVKGINPGGRGNGWKEYQSSADCQGQSSNNEKHSPAAKGRS